MSRILLVTPTFPPDQNSIAIVVGRFARALADCGWKVSVLSGRRTGVNDEAAGAAADGLQAVHSFDASGYLNYRGILRPIVKTACGLLPYRESLLWMAALRRRLNVILARESFDAVLGVNGSSPAVLAAVARVPAPGIRKACWYIDPWYLVSGLSFRENFKRALWARIENSCLPQFDGLFFHTPELRDAYARIRPDLASRMHVLYNAYDPADLPAVGPSAGPTAEKVLRIGYFGTVRPEEARVLLRLFDASSRLPPASTRLEFYIHGWFDHRARKTLGRWFATHSPSFRYRELTNPVPFPDLLREMQACDFLLTSRSDRLRHNHTGKIFWYLGLRRAVLYLGPAGAAEGRLVDSAACGKVFDWRTTDSDLAAFLETALAAKTAGKPFAQPDETFLNSLTTAAQAEVFTRVVSAGLEPARA